MSHARAQLTARRKILLIQTALVGAVVGLFILLQGRQAGMAAIYGSIIVVLVYRLQVWQLKRADRIAGLSAERNMRYLYRCAAERFVATVVLLAVGIIMLRLEPLPLLAGYIIAQAALVYGWFLESSARRKHG
ncbi:MAG: ATP synthase subunit I [Pseudomonadota bacterium]